MAHSILKATSHLFTLWIPARGITRVSAFALLIAAGLAWPGTAQAQFTYIGAHAGYNPGTFRFGIYKWMMHHQLLGGLSAGYRPSRRIAFWLQLDQGLLQGTTHRFDDGCNTCNWDSPNNSDSRARYVPYDFDYTIKKSTAIALQARLHFGEKSNSYLGLSVDYFTFEETFEFHRSAMPAQYWSASGDLQYGAVSTLHLRSRTSHKMLVPGLSLGTVPHLTEHLYLDFGYTLQLLTFDGPSFSYVIENDWDSINDVPETSRVESPLKSLKVGHRIAIGLGYVF